MIFGDRSIVGPEKNFNSTDLYQYAELLIKEAIQHDGSVERSNYSWLKAKPTVETSTEQYLEDLKPMINKMTSVNCAATAVKLDKLTEERIYPIADLLTLMKNLIQEQDSMKTLEQNISRLKHRRVNKVHPELSGRQATVSFVLEYYNN